MAEGLLFIGPAIDRSNAMCYLLHQLVQDISTINKESKSERVVSMGLVVGKAELVDRIASLANGTKKEAELYLKATVEAISDAFCDGEEVSLKGFGKFTLSISAAREGRNPQDPSKTLQIAPSVHVRFKPGNDLTASVNSKGTVDAIAKSNKDSKDIQDRAKAWKDAHK